MSSLPEISRSSLIPHPSSLIEGSDRKGLSETPDAVVAREEKYLVTNYARLAFHPRSGKGARLVDAAGKSYWDLLGGIAVNALGHAHPALIKTLREESRSLLHVSNLYFHPAQGLLAERLIAASGLSRVFFCNSGTEANEAALKFARLRNPGRSHVLALEESFHGRTFGSLSLTGHESYRTPFEPLVPGATFIAPNDIDALTGAVTDETSAIFLEPILGEGGIIPLTREFLRKARELADRTGAMLVFDEIQCGLGRTGAMFAFEHAGVVPDIVTLAKPLGGGLPLGAVIVGSALEGLVKPGHHGTTFGGNPIACRLAATFLDVIERDDLLDRVKTMGASFGAALKKLQRRLPAIVDVRGKGLMWGIELDREAKPVVAALLEHGFVVGTARERVLRLLPPYTVPKKALTEFVKTLGDILKKGEVS